MALNPLFHTRKEHIQTKWFPCVIIIRSIFFPKTGHVIQRLQHGVYLYMIFIHSFGYDICHSFARSLVADITSSLMDKNHIHIHTWYTLFIYIYIEIYLFKVQSHITELLLDVTHDFTFSRSGEGITSFCQDLHEIVCQVAAGKIQT